MVRRRLAGGGGLAEQGRAWVQVPPGARSVRSQARVVPAGAWGEARSDAGFGGVPGRSCGGAKNSAAEEVSRRDSVAGPPEDCEIAPNSRELKRAAETPWNGVSDRGKPFGNSPGRDVCGLKVRRDFRYWVRNKPIWSGCSADCAEKPHGGAPKAGLCRPNTECSALRNTVVRLRAGAGGRDLVSHGMGSEACYWKWRPEEVAPGRTSRRFSSIAQRAARDRNPQHLTAFHATVRTAREESGFKAGLRRREKSGLERGQNGPRHLHDHAVSSPTGPGSCSS